MRGESYVSAGEMGTAECGLRAQPDCPPYRGSAPDELNAVESRSIRFIDKDSAEHVATIFGSAWPSSIASFSSSSSMWTMSSGSPLAGTRKLQQRPSSSQIS